MDRRLFIVIAVVGFHVLGLWALQTGLLRRAVELVVPVEVLAELIELPQPQVTPAPPPPQPHPKPVQKPVTPPPPVPKQAPQPMAIADPAPSASAPAGTTEPQAAAPPIQSPPSRSEAPADTAAAIPRETIPSTNIDHRFRPQPPYPTLSTRLGEEGVVTLKVMVSKDGRPLNVQVVRSSGYLRLDDVAEQTVKNRWRFTPGTSSGVPVDMEATIFVRFSLEP